MRHGGDLGDLAATQPLAPRPWVDLSTGINPHTYPVTSADVLKGLGSLPEKGAVMELLAAARHAYQVPPDLKIVSASGTQALIQLMPSLSDFQNVSVIEPSYSEHREAFERSNYQTKVFRHPVDLNEIDTNAIVSIVNPNNPDGRLIDPAALLKLARLITKDGGILVLDEAFADVVANSSIIPLLTNERVIVLRSFGKFYGLAGLRLGFAIGHPELVSRLDDNLGPWAVGTPALSIGVKALLDDAWRKNTYESLIASASRLDELILERKLELVGGTSLFRLYKTDAGKQPLSFHQHLAQNGIWTRVFKNYPDWIRLGLPGNEEAWSRLVSAVKSWHGH